MKSNAFGLIKILVSCLVFAPCAFAQAPGSIDTGFGTNGTVLTPVSIRDQAQAVAIQQDGKIVVIGSSDNGTDADNDFSVVRYNPNGTLDLSFGSGGKVRTDVSGGGRKDFAKALAIQTDGKIVVAGYTYQPDNFPDIGVARYDSNGALDPTFGTGGIVVTAIGPQGDLGNAVAIQADGKIVVAGETSIPNQSRDYTVVRYNSNGSLDTSFDGDGIVTTDYRLQYNAFQSVAIQSDGKIVGAGYTTPGNSPGQTAISAVRYNSSGSLDTGFGAAGEAMADISTVGSDFGTSVVLQTDQKIIVAGLSNNTVVSRFALVRFDTDGTLDGMFGTGGIVTTSGISDARSVMLQSNGEIIAAGRGQAFAFGAIARYHPNGTLDAGFGTGGVVLGPGGEITSAALQQDGKIVVAGYRSDGSNDDFIVARFLGEPTAPMLIRSPFDFDGDGKTDVSIFRPGPGEWWYLRSSNGTNRAFQFGNSSDKIVPVDFTGDGKTDIGFWRTASGEWFILRSEDYSYYSFPFGTSGDIPAPADFDGDGKADPAIFRPSSATWFIIRSTDGGTTIATFGADGDVPIPADFDGDSKADLAIYRPSLGQWWIQRSTAGLIAFQFGTAADKPVAGDYTGDGKTDVAIWRPSSGEWFILRSEDSSFYSFPFGTATDKPVSGDYDGDGKTDPGVFRSGNSTWYVLRSTAGTAITGFGQTGDIPLPGAFVP